MCGPHQAPQGAAAASWEEGQLSRPHLVQIIVSGCWGSPGQDPDLPQYLLDPPPTPSARPGGTQPPHPRVEDALLQKAHTYVHLRVPTGTPTRP